MQKCKGVALKVIPFLMCINPLSKLKYGWLQIVKRIFVRY